MAKVDIKDAYYSARILPEHHQYWKLLFSRKNLSVYLLNKWSIFWSQKVYLVVKTATRLFDKVINSNSCLY